MQLHVSKEIHAAPTVWELTGVRFRVPIIAFSGRMEGTFESFMLAEKLPFEEDAGQGLTSSHVHLVW